MPNNIFSPSGNGNVRPIILVPSGERVHVKSHNLTRCRLQQDHDQDQQDQEDHVQQQQQQGHEQQQQTGHTPGGRAPYLATDGRAPHRGRDRDRSHDRPVTLLLLGPFPCGTR